MRKDWALITIIGLILVVGLGLIGYLKIGKKNVTANPLPSTNQEVAGASNDQAAYFSNDAKVMYFFSDYCHWCQKEKDEVLSVLATQGYKVKPMNVGTSPDLAKQYNISGTPTFIAANGDRVVGYQDKDALKTFLENHK